MKPRDSANGDGSDDDDIRVVMAFFLAPLSVPLSMLPIVAFSDGKSIAKIIIVVLGAVASYGGTFVFGIPAYSFLKARRVTAAWAAVATGLAIGAITWVLFSVLLPLSLGQGLSGVRFALIDRRMMSGVLWPGGVEGALVGAVYWLIARPDRRTNWNAG
jgi:hypothetical protein